MVTASRALGASCSAVEELWAATAVVAFLAAAWQEANNVWGGLCGVGRIPWHGSFRLRSSRLAWCRGP